MKFQVLDIIPHLKNPVTGEIVSTAERLRQVVQAARRAEELGFDSFAVGERHAGEFISSSPTTVLAAIAAVTTRIRLQTGVTVLSVLDPVRVDRSNDDDAPPLRWFAADLARLGYNLDVGRPRGQMG